MIEQSAVDFSKQLFGIIEFGIVGLRCAVNTGYILFTVTGNGFLVLHCVSQDIEHTALGLWLFVIYEMNNSHSYLLGSCSASSS